jgi:hypothetical protein
MRSRKQNQTESKRIDDLVLEVVAPSKHTSDLVAGAPPCASCTDNIPQLIQTATENYKNLGSDIKISRGYIDPFRVDTLAPRNGVRSN